MRKDSFFYKNQPMQGIGLLPVDTSLANRKGNASGAMAMLFDEMDTYLGNNHKNYYFTYGWSGLMSPTVRYKESVHFFEVLEQEMAKFHAQNIYPKLRIIGYSHGGNVCLNLGRARQKVFPNSSLVINELILIGSPIQGETDFLVNDQLFEKAYHFYSDGDRIQQLDFFSFDRFFSNRTFEAYSAFTPQKKLTQVQLKVMRCTPSTRRSQKKLELSKNLENTALLAGNSHLIRDASPGHSELWFFGWTPVNYREIFPLNPFPTITFAPHIIHELQQLENVLPSPQPIVVDLRPEQGQMLIKKQSSIDVFKVVDFVPQTTLTQWRLKLQSYVPDAYTPEEYNQHIRLAYEHASLDYARENEKLNPRAIKHQQKIQRRTKKKLDQVLLVKEPKKKDKKKSIITESLHVKLDCPFCEHTATTAL
ncbi:MAG TPA: hypothetical protein PLU71_02810 [Candidatus Dependentiae bacterium]|nr:hypothetical protein [Candidatus Dependentiae bacterium]HRQ62761.1 hypothetical protein [Candidatus Dependentiae bacterium]